MIPKLEKIERKYTKAYVDNEETKWFIIDDRGSIIDTGSKHKSDWDSVVVNMHTVKVGEPISLSFNEKEYRKLAEESRKKKKGPESNIDFISKIRYTKLAYNTTKIETLKKID